MVSWSGHILPILVTIVVWFFATGLIAWLDNRDTSVFPRILIIAGAAGMAGLGLILAAMHSVSAGGMYASFIGALLVWSWHEIGFLTGAVAGPRRAPCPRGASGWSRFTQATATVIYHEVALALTALILVALSWKAANPLGAQVFCLMLVLRLSTKLNLFLGVPNASTDILPPHLGYLKSYFGSNRLTFALVISTAASVALAGWIGSQAWSADATGPAAVAASLLFAIAALGAVEHLFLATPVRDGALWGWALPRARRQLHQHIPNG